MRMAFLYRCVLWAVFLKSSIIRVMSEKSSLSIASEQCQRDYGELESQLELLSDNNTLASEYLEMKQVLSDTEARLEEIRSTLDTLKETNTRLEEQVATGDVRLNVLSKENARLLTDLVASKKALETIVYQAVRGKEYASVGGGHWIKEVIGTGKYVVLEDNSLWKISGMDRIDVALWLPITDITVVDNADTFLPYYLVNTDDGEEAGAQYVGQQ